MADSARPSLGHTIYCGWIDVCSSDFHVQEFRRNSSAVSFAVISPDSVSFFFFSRAFLRLFSTPFLDLGDKQTTFLKFNVMSYPRRFPFVSLSTSDRFVSYIGDLSVCLYDATPADATVENRGWNRYRVATKRRGCANNFQRPERRRIDRENWIFSLRKYFHRLGRAD